MKSLPPALARVAFFLAALLVVLAANRAQFASVYHETRDLAANSLRIQEAKRGELLTGNYSRLGFHHPGPAILDVLAVGEVTFHDTLGWVRSPIMGQAIAAGIYNAAWATLLLVLLGRLYGSTAAGLAATGGLLAAAGLVDREYLQSLWFPYLYFMPFAAWCAALARLAQRGWDGLWPAALAAGFVVHGHASFVAFVGLMGAGVAAWIAWQLRGEAPPGARWTAFRAEAHMHRRSWIAASVIALVFMAPIVLDTVLHFPGEIPKYLGYGYGRAKVANSVLASGGFVAGFWGGKLAFIVGGVLLALVAWRPASPATRPLAWVVALATLALLFYARNGIDDLKWRYTAFFYFAPVALAGVALVLDLLARLGRAGRLLVPAAAAVTLVIAAWRVPPTHVDHSPSIPAVADMLRAVQPSPVVLDLDGAVDWGGVWGLVVGVEAYGERRGERFLCVNAGWHILFAKRYRCSDAEVASGTRFAVTARPDSRRASDGGGSWEGIHFIPSRPPRLGPGDAIGFGVPDMMTARRVLRDGWAHNEDRFTWSTGRVSTLEIEVDPAALPLKVTLDALAFVPGVAPSQTVRAYSRGRELGRHTFTAASPRASWTFTLPPGAADARGAVPIELRVESPRSPRSLGLSGDERELGIALHRLVLER